MHALKKKSPKPLALESQSKERNPQWQWRGQETEVADLFCNKRASVGPAGGQEKRLSVTGSQGGEKPCLWTQGPEFRLPVHSCSCVVRLLTFLAFVLSSVNRDSTLWKSCILILQRQGRCLRGVSPSSRLLLLQTSWVNPVPLSNQLPLGKGKSLWDWIL